MTFPAYVPVVIFDVFLEPSFTRPWSHFGSQGAQNDPIWSHFGDLLVTFSRSGDIAILEYLLVFLKDFRDRGGPKVINFRSFFQDLSQKAPRGHP